MNCINSESPSIEPVKASKAKNLFSTVADMALESEHYRRRSLS
jgi:hypothetical protein